MKVENQEFNLGDIAYMIDEDHRWFEGGVKAIELCKDGTIEYSTFDCDFKKEDIGVWVFKSEKDRELGQ